MKKEKRDFKYDVCLSFAGENRKYVRATANELISLGIRVFFDEIESTKLWGKDLYEHLADIYKNSAKYCIMFISKNYSKKLWTTHERKNAQARAFRENEEYILPVRFDNTNIPGIRETTGYINLKRVSPKTLAKMISDKIGPRIHKNFLPSGPLDLLYKELGVKSMAEKEIVNIRAHSFFEVLERMSKDERAVIMTILLEGCSVELPKNTHINLDLIPRYTGFTESKIKRILGGLKSMGFFTKIIEGKDKSYLGNSPQVRLEYHVLNTDEFGGNATSEVRGMIFCAIEGYCNECGMKRLNDLDFSNLSSYTYKSEKKLKRKTRKNSPKS